MDVYFKMGQKIKELRIRRNLTQSQLGEMIGGYANTYVSQMENGKRKISIEFLEKIADVLDVDVTHFFDKSQEVNLPDGTDAFVLKPDDMEGVTPEEIMEFIRMAQKMKNNK